MEGLRARDPRGSNPVYSVLVGPPPVVKDAAAAVGAPATAAPTPVALTFRYAKEMSGGGRAATAGGASVASSGGGGATQTVAAAGPWETSALSLNFTELQVLLLSLSALCGRDFHRAPLCVRGVGRGGT